MELICPLAGSVDPVLLMTMLPPYPVNTCLYLIFVLLSAHCNGSGSWRDISLFKRFKKNDCECSVTDSGDTHIYNAPHTKPSHNSNQTCEAQETSQKRAQNGYQSRRTERSTVKACPSAHDMVFVHLYGTCRRSSQLSIPA